MHASATRGVGEPAGAARDLVGAVALTRVPVAPPLQEAVDGISLLILQGYPGLPVQTARPDQCQASARPQVVGSPFPGENMVLGDIVHERHGASEREGRSVRGL